MSDGVSERPPHTPLEVALAALAACYRGFHVRYGGDSLRLAPPFVSTEQEIKQRCGALAECLEGLPDTRA